MHFTVQLWIIPMAIGSSTTKMTSILIMIGFAILISQNALLNNLIERQIVAAETILPSRVSHIIVIILENADYSSIIGSSSASYMASIADQYALLTDYHGLSHPSLPNYLGIIAGSSFNITDDRSPINHTSIAGNKVITSLIDSKGLSWKSYMESMPLPCDKISSGLYAVKHNPFVYFNDFTKNTIYCNNHVVDFVQLEQDIRNNNVPNLAFVTPNMKNDGHNTGLSFSDSWLKGFLPKVISSTFFDSSVIFITFDEDRPYTEKNHVYAVIVGPKNLVKMGFKSTSSYNHYSLLATIENIYGLGSLGRNDDKARIIDDVFQKVGKTDSTSILFPGTIGIYWPLIVGLTLIPAILAYPLYRRYKLKKS